MSYKLPSAHAIPINRETAFPLYYNDDDDESNTIQGQIQNDTPPEAIPYIPETEIITVASTKPSLFSPFGHSNKDIDIDISLFKNTCLEDIILTDTEIGMLKDKLKYTKNPKEFIKNNISYYCNIRDIILSQMPDFPYKYPSLFSQVLSRCLDDSKTSSESFINNIVNLVSDQNITELNRKENDTELHYGSRILSSQLEKYKPTPMLLPRNKNIGGTRRNKKTTKRNRKTTKCKNKKRKSHKNKM